MAPPGAYVNKTIVETNTASGFWQYDADYGVNDAAHGGRLGGRRGGRYPQQRVRAGKLHCHVQHGEHELRCR